MSAVDFRLVLSMEWLWAATLDLTGLTRAHVGPDRWYGGQAPSGADAKAVVQQGKRESAEQLALMKAAIFAADGIEVATLFQPYPPPSDEEPIPFSNYVPTHNSFDPWDAAVVLNAEGSLELMRYDGLSFERELSERKAILELDFVTTDGALPFGLIEEVDDEPLPVLADRRSMEEFKRTAPQRARARYRNAAHAALQVAPLYVLRALPSIEHYPLDPLLAWRDDLAESLAAYREAVAAAISASTELDEEAELEDFVRVVSLRLDHLADDVGRQALSTSFRSVLGERRPPLAATGAGLALGLASAGGGTIAAFNAVLAGGLSQGIITAYTAFRRQESLRQHPLYWRYALDRAVTD